MQHTFIKLSLLAIVVFLSGCANQRFDCPYQDGVKCKSLSEVDEGISQGKIGMEKLNLTLTKLAPAKALDAPYRSPEEILSIWVAPYQSVDGTFFEEKTMHIVAKPAAWTALPETQRDN